MIKAMTWSIVGMKKGVNYLEAEKSLLVKMSKVFLSYSSQINMSGGLLTDTFLKRIPPMCLGFSFKVENPF